MKPQGGIRFPALDLGEVLVRQRRITPEQRAAAEAAAREHSLSFRDAIVGQSVLTEEEAQFFLARAIGIPYLNVNAHVVDRGVLARYPAEVLWRYRALPLRETPKGVLMAIADPHAAQALADLQALSPTPLQFALALRIEIEEALRRVLAKTSLGPLLAHTRGAPENVTDPSGVVFTYGLLVKAVQLGADELSLEANGGWLAVSFRAYGFLLAREEHPVALLFPAFTRLRLLTGMTGTGAGHGMLRTRIGEADLELRARITPTAGGSTASVRFARLGDTPANLEHWPIEPKDLARIAALVAAPRGFLLVGTPDADLGRALALSLAARAASCGGRRAFSLFLGERSGAQGVLPFAAGGEDALERARAIEEALAHRPGVLAIATPDGQAELAPLLQAAEVDCLVIATVPVASLPKALLYLKADGANPVLLAEALLGGIAVRSLGRLCTECREKAAGGYRRKGCTRCARTGYGGRVLAVEVGGVVAAAREAVASGADASAVADALRGQGWVPISECVAGLAAAGVVEAGAG
ncbi:MAG: hypothetical protein HYZ53_28415 [Planctomycetes bacterium]|nr:hypothetical protein [Planctomycetota bacterium]